MITEKEIINILEKNFNKYSLSDLELKKDSPVFANLIRNNSQIANNKCIIFYGENGIFIFVLDSHNNNEISSLRKITFEKIKGLKINNVKNKDKVNIITDLGGHYEFDIISDYNDFFPNNIQYKNELLNKLKSLETKETIEHIDNISKNKLKEKILYFIPLIFICLIFLQYSKNMGKIEFFLKLILVFIVYGLIFSSIRIIISSLGDRHFSKNYNLIMKTFIDDNDKTKLFNSLVNIEYMPKNSINKNIYFVSCAGAALSLQKIDDAKKFISRVIIDDQNAPMSNQIKEQYIAIKNELEEYENIGDMNDK